MTRFNIAAMELSMNLRKVSSSSVAGGHIIVMQIEKWPTDKTSGFIQLYKDLGLNCLKISLYIIYMSARSDIICGSS